MFFFFQAEDGIRDRSPSRGLGDVYKRQIVRNPKVFLMDEPLSNLDAKLRVQMRQEISKLHRQLGTTIIYVTHDQTEAMTLGTRIVVMKDGVVQQIDTPVSYTHLRAHETDSYLVCRLLLEKKKRI